MATLTHLGQYWSASRGEIRLFGGSGLEVSGGTQTLSDAWDLTDCLPLPGHRRSYRRAAPEESWEAARWTFSGLPTPVV